MPWWAFLILFSMSLIHVCSQYLRYAMASNAAVDQAAKEAVDQLTPKTKLDHTVEQYMKRDPFDATATIDFLMDTDELENPFSLVPAKELPPRAWHSWHEDSVKHAIKTVYAEPAPQMDCDTCGILLIGSGISRCTTCQRQWDAQKLKVRHRDAKGRFCKAPPTISISDAGQRWFEAQSKKQETENTIMYLKQIGIHSPIYQEAAMKVLLPGKTIRA